MVKLDSTQNRCITKIGSLKVSYTGMTLRLRIPISKRDATGPTGFELGTPRKSVRVVIHFNPPPPSHPNDTLSLICSKIK